MHVFSDKCLQSCFNSSPAGLYDGRFAYLLWALTFCDLRAQTRASAGRESESSAAAPGSAEPAAQPHPQLSAHQQDGQGAAGGDEENSPTK